LLLAEVHVVHGGDGGETRAAGSRQRAERDSLDLVVTIRLEPVATNHARAVVQDGFVVGNRRELDHATSILTTVGDGRRPGAAAPTSAPTIATRRHPRPGTAAAPP